MAAGKSLVPSGFSRGLSAILESLALERSKKTTVPKLSRVAARPTPTAEHSQGIRRYSRLKFFRKLDQRGRRR